MDLKQLTALVTVADSGSVTRAADVLHLVQPAVSRQIQLLEAELGTPLFERSTRGMRPTADGEILVEHARRALRELERAREQIRPASGELHGLVAVGLLPSLADPLSEALVRRIGGEHPAVRLRLSVGYAGHLAQWIDSADVDLALLYDVRPSTAVDVRPLLDEPLWVIGPKGTDLRPDRPVRLADVGDRLRILPGPPHALRSMVDRAAARENLTLRIDVETNSMTVQRRLALSGAGLTVLPGIAIADGLRGGTLAAAPLADPDLRRRLLLTFPGTRRVGRAARAVADILVEELARLLGDGAWPSATWLGKQR
ncbi:LysR family transcriptional regulator [Nonomuraea sp. NPDC050153]|uniref:LysR family transcriptional regulator n=1 Tax=Nonomuraea sp. NPDC050153 TaxID=3364359 RepID=UPI0037BE0B1F